MINTLILILKLRNIRGGQVTGNLPLGKIPCEAVFTTNPVGLMLSTSFVGGIIIEQLFQIFINYLGI